jgi:GNAT superfamily N-acetyltransferase
VYVWGSFPRSAPSSRKVLIWRDRGRGRARSGDLVYHWELYAIYLLEGWQHRGIGRQLTMAFGSWLIAARLASLLV